MIEYRRAYVPGDPWFFTVNLAERKTNRLLVEKIDLLCSAFEYTKQRYPFHMDAAVILNKASIPRIGEIMKTMISRGLNDTTDAPPYGRHILPSLFSFGKSLMHINIFRFN